MPPSERVTLRDVARIAGVSHNTVSLVLRDSSRVLPATRERVQAVIDRLGYQPHAAAAALRSARAGAIGHLIQRGPEPQAVTEVDMFRNWVWRGITDTAEAKGYFVLQSGFADVRRSKALLSSGRVDGLLVDVLVPDSLIAEIATHGAPPIVVIGRDCEVPGVSWVRADEEGGAYVATQHLLALGHREIALVTVRSESHPTARAREAGMQHALADASLEASPRTWFGDWTFESGQRIGREIALAERRPTALFVLNEAMAAGCVRGLQQAGYGVPGDLAVATVEDSRWVEYLDPPLTAVHVPMYRVASRATELLLGQIEGGDTEGGDVEHDTIGTEFVIRASTRP